MEIAVTLGRRGGKSLLPESVHKGETRRGRRPLAQTVFEGAFPGA